MTRWDELGTLFAHPTGRMVDGAPGRPCVQYQRDLPAAAVYAAEQQVRTVLQEPVLYGAQIQDYVNEVMALPWPRWGRSGGNWAVRVTIEQGVTIATYGSGEIIVPSPVRAFVILHELAHHLTNTMTHDTLWVQAFLDLTEHAVNPVVAQLFRDAFIANGVAT